MSNKKTSTKKSSYLPILILILTFIFVIYAVDIYTGKYIIIMGDDNEFQNLVDINTENAESLINVNYSTLISFLNNDTTDEHEYIYFSYICIDFTLDLLHNASLHNISSGMAIIDYHTWDGHCISCFNTTDAGVIFIEPQSDTDITNKINILNSYPTKTIYAIHTYWN